jgi:DNA invertase Pin-like site-specific DNA recombinase
VSRRQADDAPWFALKVVVSRWSRARATGTRSGRATGRPAAPDKINEKIRGLLAGRESQREIAPQLGVSRGAVYRVCAEMKAVH